MTAAAPAGMPAVTGKGYRAKFLLRLSLIVAAGAVLLFLTLFAVFSRPLAGDYGNVFFALRHLVEFLFPIIAFSVLAYTLIVCAATAVLCVYALHKVAGPLYRMERVVESFSAGAPFSPVAFRQGDQGAVLADAFNDFAGRLGRDRDAMRDLMRRAEASFADDPAGPGTEARKALEGILAVLSRYR